MRCTLSPTAKKWAWRIGAAATALACGATAFLVWDDMEENHPQYTQKFSDDLHLSQQATQWALTGAATLLGGAVMGVGVYLDERKRRSQHRDSMFGHMPEGESRPLLADSRIREQRVGILDRLHQQAMAIIENTGKLAPARVGEWGGAMADALEALAQTYAPAAEGEARKDGVPKQLSDLLDGYTESVSNAIQGTATTESLEATINIIKGHDSVARLPGPQPAARGWCGMQCC